MENERKIVAVVKSPTKYEHFRESKGFSLAEIKKAGKSVELLKKLNLKVDYFRISVHDSNVEKLKNLKPFETKQKKREPFVFKEKKRRPFKPKKERIITKSEKASETIPKKKVAKPTLIKEKEVKAEPAPAIEKALKVETNKTPLTQLSGLGPATEKKLVELGIDCVEELCKKNPEDLKQTIKGVSEKKIKNWIEEGNELLK